MPGGLARIFAKAQEVVARETATPTAEQQQQQRTFDTLWAKDTYGDRPDANVVASGAKALGLAGLSGVSNVPKVPGRALRWLDNATGNVVSEHVPLVQEMLNDDLRFTDESDFRYQHAISQNVDDVKRQYPLLGYLLEQATGAATSVGEMATTAALTAGAAPVAQGSKALLQTAYPVLQNVQRLWGAAPVLSEMAASVGGAKSDELKQRGYSGPASALFGASYGLAEAIPEVIGARLGALGVESPLIAQRMSELVERGIGQALKRMGVNGLEEIPQELATKLMQDGLDVVLGDRQAPSADFASLDQYAGEIADMSVQTLMMAGLTGAPGVARATLDTVADQNASLRQEAAQPARQSLMMDLQDQLGVLQHQRQQDAQLENLAQFLSEPMQLARGADLREGAERERAVNYAERLRALRDARQGAQEQAKLESEAKRAAEVAVAQGQEQAALAQLVQGAIAQVPQGERLRLWGDEAAQLQGDLASVGGSGVAVGSGQWSGPEQESSTPRLLGWQGQEAQPSQVDQAAAKAEAAPTQAQKEAGNYRKGHVQLHGLNITIENEAGSERSGTDKGGKPWSVTMPAHYGYIRRTEGADGDQVDVYLGPQAEDAQAPVFIIDQVDAETGDFDEHKVMLGFPDRESATAAYDAGFSDGRGPQRRATVMKIEMLRFQQWLKTGNHKRPVSPSLVSMHRAQLQRAAAEKTPQEQTQEADPQRYAQAASERVGKLDEKMKAHVLADPQRRAHWIDRTAEDLTAEQGHGQSGTAKLLAVQALDAALGQGNNENNTGGVKWTKATLTPTRQGIQTQVVEANGLKPGQWVRFVRGKKTGTRAVVESLTAEGRPILRGEDGKLIGGKFGITPDNLEAEGAQDRSQESTPPRAGTVQREGRGSAVQQDADNDGATAHDAAGAPDRAARDEISEADLAAELKRRAEARRAKRENDKHNETGIVGPVFDSASPSERLDGHPMDDGMVSLVHDQRMASEAARELAQFARDKSGTIPYKSLVFATLSEGDAQRLSAASGMTIQRGAWMVMTAHDLRHAFKQHGDAAKEAQRGQEPITPELVAQVPLIPVSQWDLVAQSTDASGAPVLVLREPGGIVMADVVVRKGRRLVVRTVYKQKGDRGTEAKGTKPVISTAYRSPSKRIIRQQDGQVNERLTPPISDDRAEQRERNIAKMAERAARDAALQSEMDDLSAQLKRLMEGRGGSAGALGGEGFDLVLKILANRVKAGVYRLSDALQDLFARVPRELFAEDDLAELDAAWDDVVELVPGAEPRGELTAAGVATKIGQNKVNTQGANDEGKQGREGRDSADTDAGNGPGGSGSGLGDRQLPGRNGPGLLDGRSSNRAAREADQPDHGSGGRSGADGADAATDSGAQRPDAGTTGTLRARTQDATGRKRTVNTAPRPETGWRWEKASDALPGGEITRARESLAAIRLSKQLVAESRAATREEQQVLARFAGWGAIKLVVNDAHRYAQDTKGELYREAKALLTEEEWQAAEGATLNAHYTHPAVVAQVWDLVAKLLPEGTGPIRALEPSVGMGAFIGLQPLALRERTRWTAIEYDATTARIAKQLYTDAAVLHKGYQAHTMPDGSYDLAISNVPFGDWSVYDPRYDQHKARIHDFFFLKAFDQVREGGLVVFITSTGTLDKQDHTIRAALAKAGAELVGAVRYPGGAHKQNAGTEVVTDLIVLRKLTSAERKERKRAPQWLGVGTVPDPAGGEAIPLNQYFIKNPDKVLGTIDRSGSLYAGNRMNVVAGPDFAKDERKALDGIAKQAKALGLGMTVPETKKTRPEIPAPDMLRPYALFAKDGAVYQKQQDGTAVQVRAKDGKRVAWMRDLVAALRATWAAELSGHSASKERKKLNAVYDAGRATFGPLNDRVNAQAFVLDPDAPNLLSLEKQSGEDDKGKPIWSKGPVFERATVSPPKAVGTAKSIEEAIGFSLSEMGRIDPREVARAFQISEEEAERRLGEGNAAFKTPGGQWEPAWQYLSGNVKQKLAEAMLEASTTQPALMRNVEALRKVQPKDKTPDQIVFTLGASYIPRTVMHGFIESTFGHRITVTKASEGRYVITGEAGSAGEAAWRVKGKYRVAEASDILDAAINGRFVDMSLKDRDGNVHKDPEGEKAAADKANELRRYFRDWIALPSNSAHLKEATRFYNETMNVWHEEPMDTSWVRFEGMSTMVTPDMHQRAAVAHAVMQGRGLWAHEVGTGKTLSMISAAMEMKRLGIARKPMIATLNQLVDQVASDAASLFPGKRILRQPAAWGPKGSPTSRAAFLARLANDEYDLAVVSHTSMSSILPSAEAMRQRLEEKIKEMKAAYDAVKEAEGGGKRDGRAASNLRKRLEKLKEKERELRDYKPAVDNISWEDTGVDALFVDEAHSFKNLQILTAKQRVKGISQNESKRAEDLLVKAQILNQINGGERGLFLATGTPISNTLPEIFAMQQYLMRKTLAGLSVQYFDDWARSFATERSSPEVQANGERQMVARFTEWVNLGELTGMLRPVMSTVFTTDVPRIVASLPDSREVSVSVPQTLVQRAYREWIAERIERIKKQQGKPTKGMDLVMVAWGDAKLSAIDMRLVDPDAGPQDGSKVQELANTVGKLYREGPRVSKDQPPVQFIFQDVRAKPTAWGFDLNTAIVEALVGQGIPREHIAVIRGGMKKRDVTAIKNKAKLGGYAVLIGGTETLGTGTNAQEFALATHHIDIPHRPSDVVQRDGRAVRQGNRYKGQGVSALLHRYVVTGTMDESLWQRIGIKRHMINTFLANAAERDMAEVETSDFDPDMMAAIASGDTDLVRVIELEDEHGRLKRSQQGHAARKAYLSDKAKMENEWAERSRENARSLAELQSRLEGKVPDKPEIYWEKRKIDEKELEALWEEWARVKRDVTLTWAGEPVALRWNKFHNYAHVNLGPIEMEIQSPGGLLPTLKRHANDLAGKIAITKQLGEQYQKTADEAAREAEKVGDWPHQAELERVETQLREVQERIAQRPPQEGVLNDELRQRFERGLAARKQSGEIDEDLAKASAEPQEEDAEGNTEDDAEDDANEDAAPARAAGPQRSPVRELDEERTLPDGLAEALGTPNYPVVLRKKDMDHIEAGHGDQLRKQGITDIRGFIESVIDDADAAYTGKGTSLLLVRTSERVGVVAVQVQMVDDQYVVRTAWQMSKASAEKYLAKQKRVQWARHPQPARKSGQPDSVAPVTDAGQRDGWGGSESTESTGMVSKEQGEGKQRASKRELDEPAPRDAKGSIGIAPSGRPFEQKARPATAERPRPAPIAGRGSAVLAKTFKASIQGLTQALRAAGLGRVAVRGPLAVPKGSGGIYDPNTGLLAIGYHGDLDATAHEMGHALDHHYQFSAQKDQGLGREIGYFARWGSEPDASLTDKESRDAYRRREGVAEWVRAWLVNPEEAQRLAPNLHAVFERSTPKAVREALRTWGDEVRSIAGLPEQERTHWNVQSFETMLAEETSTIRRALAWLRNPFGLLGRKENLSRKPEAPTIPKYSATLKERMEFHWTNEMALAFHRWQDAWERRGANLATFTPEQRFDVMHDLLAGTNGKVREMLFGAGLTDSRLRPVFDDGQRMNLGWLLSPFEGKTYSQASRLIDKALAMMVEERTQAEGARRHQQGERDIAAMYEAIAKVIGDGQRSPVDAGADARALRERFLELVKDKEKAQALADKALALSREGRAEELGIIAVDSLGQVTVSDLAMKKAFGALMAPWSEARRKQARIEASRITGIGGGLHSDTVQATKALKHREADPETPLLQEFARRYRRWAQHLLIYAADQGMFSAKQLEKIKESGSYTDPETGEVFDVYVDLHRVFEGQDNPNVVGQRFHGSTRQIANPLDNLLWATANTIARADRNKVMNLFVEPLRPEHGNGWNRAGESVADLGHQVDLERYKEAQKQGTIRDENGRRVYFLKNDGKTEAWVFDAASEASFEASRMQSTDHIFLQVMEPINRVRKAMITMSPAFLIRQVPRDLMSRLIDSDNQSGLKDFAQAYGKTGGRDTGEAYALAGGSYAGWVAKDHDAMRKEIAEHLAELTNRNGVVLRSWTALKRGAEWLQEQSDASNRRAEFAAAYRAAEAKGYDPYNAMLHAAHASRSLIDFARRGRIAKQVNTVVLFFNPMMQSFVRLYNTFRQRPGRTLLRLAIYMGSISALLAAFRDSDDDEEWRNQPAHIRDFHWLLRVGDLRISIPKPYEYGWLISGAERLADAELATNEADRRKAFDGYAASGLGAIVPLDHSALTGSFTPMVEVLTNYDLFRGRSIVSPWELGLDLERRSGTKYASPLAQGLQRVVGVDARKLDHLINGYLGGYGRMLTSLGEDGRMLGSATGVVKSDPLWSARDVEWVREQVGRTGQSGHRWNKELTLLLRAAAEAQGQERDRKARLARNYAAKVRAYLETHDGLLPKRAG